MDLKTAYELLGLKAEATVEDLEARYYDLTEQRTSTEKLEHIQAAYNIVQAHLKETNPPPKDPWHTRIKDFIYIYKLHLFLWIIGVIVVGSLVFTFVNGAKEKRYEAQNPPDIYIAFFGNYGQEDLEPLESKLKEKFPGWDNIRLHIEFAPGAPGTETNVAAAQKSQIFLATEKPDIYIFDEHYFTVFNDDTIYTKLDQLKNVENHLEDENGNAVGIDVTDHEMFQDTINAKEKKYMVLPETSNQIENATQLIMELAESF